MFLRKIFVQFLVGLGKILLSICWNIFDGERTSEKKFVVVDGEGRSAGNEGRRGQDVALPCINHNLTSSNMLQITHIHIYIL